VKVVVDLDRCEANALCMGLAPEVFLVDDDEELTVLDDEPGDALRPAVEAAINACPRQAISIQE
jgi:ferredoxin